MRKTKFKVGDWVKPINDSRCVMDILNTKCECKMSQIVYIYRNNFIITECYNTETFKHHLKGYEIEDIEKVDINAR